MSARWNLEHRLWAFLKEEGFTNSRFVLACSGGADSMALLHAFHAVCKADKLTVVSIHHGDSGSREQNAFRDRSYELVRVTCGHLGLSFEGPRFDDPKAQSEAAWRAHRRRILDEARARVGADFIVTGHHRADVLETRLLRLIRGTGPAGFVAIAPRRGVWLRPFLETEPRRLREYLGQCGASFEEDPSNQEAKYLRNWLRGTWLPQLEARHPGAVESLARSFEQLVGEQQNAGGRRFSWVKGPDGDRMSRGDWAVLSRSERLQGLADLLREGNKRDFSRGQLEEICRQLDKREKRHTFVVAGRIWTAEDSYFLSELKTE